MKALGDLPVDVDAVRGRAVAVLRQASQGDSLDARIIAAGRLIALEYPEEIVPLLHRQLDAPETTIAQRVAIWAVLARVAQYNLEEDRWTEKIRGVFLDGTAGDRRDAVRALCALGYRIRAEERDAFERAAVAEDSLLAVDARWILAQSGQDRWAAQLAGLLRSEDPATRARCGQALAHLPQIADDIQAQLVAAFAGEPSGTDARLQFAHALAVHTRDGAQRTVFVEELRAGTRSDQARLREAACDALACVGSSHGLPALTALLDDCDQRVRIAAANAVLRIDRRKPHVLAAADWAVIALYALGMLAVGWYYARRNVTTEDYLLGGRAMRPLTVGLSLYATMLSTISYLSWPGEIIRFGPMMACMVLAHPLTYLVVGWGVIPWIMKLRITSAYEILEARFGLSVRMLGSVFFLALRLMWMAVIIYATTSKVLVPLMGLDPAVTPYLCAVMALITVVYTSMGGLRAVVLTDVIQTTILFGGAILTLSLVTYHLGGVAAWWPTGWPAHWPEPTWGHDPTVRVTFLGAMLCSFTWWVCTSSSDQMAIQRYLATRDARAARRMLFTSLTCDVLLAAFLCTLGLALLAYFRSHPHCLPDGQTIITDGDQLFPRFIVARLPVGVSGLVVAGLLAAAMSSLSSGLNSSCSVITVDFIDRFRRRRLREATHMRLAKFVSAAVGLIVVVLTGYVSLVTGNLAEIAGKVVNLLVSPLAGIFFMAMFVPWATSFGTIGGAVVGLAAAFLINYWQEMGLHELTGYQGLSWMLALPVALTVQMLAGMMLSLIPIGRNRGRPLQESLDAMREETREGDL